MTDPHQTWLRTEPSLRVRVGAAGILLGRDADCDILLRDPAASRFHALVRPTARGPTVTALGRGTVSVNGSPVEQQLLADGDRIEVPGSTVSVEIEPAPPAGPTWLLVVGDGPPVRVAPGGSTLGSGGDLDREGWPSDALVLAPGDLRLGVTGGVPWTRNGAAIAAGRTVEVLPGDVLGVGDERIVVERSTGEAATTITASDLPHAVDVAFLARGGRLRVGVGRDERVLWVPERRFALLVSLLGPPPPLRAGDDVPDEIVLPLVWPRQPHKSRVDLNVLVARLRRDLEGGGGSSTWLARAEGGGGTRFRLAPGAVVTVR